MTARLQKRPLALAAIAVAIALAALAYWLRAGGGALARRDAGAAAVAPDPSGLDPLAAAGAAAAAGAEAAPTLRTAAGSIDVAPGVRLAGEGLLEGRVVERDSGRGVAGARVDLWPLPPAAADIAGRVLRLVDLGPGIAERALPVATARADATGAFAFQGVRAGTYFGEARGAWHVPDAPVLVRVAPSGNGGPALLHVRAGGRVVGRVTIAASAGGGATGGRPASGARVALGAGVGALISAARAGDLCWREERADANGRFVLAGVPPGEGYEVVALEPGRPPAHALGIAVEAGRDTEVALEVGEPATVEGVVLGERAASDGQPAGTEPLAGAHVGAIPRGLRDLYFAEEILLATECVTDAAGRYAMRGVPPGEIDLIAIAPRYVAGKGPTLASTPGARLSADPIVLRPGPMVRGRVLDAAGQPVAGALVRWDLIDFRELEFDFALAPVFAQVVDHVPYPRTDAEGRFEAGAFPGEPPHEIQVLAAGFAPAEHDWDPAAQGSEIEIRLVGGGAVEGVVLDAARLVPVTQFEVSGTDRLELAEGTPGAWNPFSGGTLIEHPEGRFRVEGVEAGTAELYFDAPGYQRTRAANLAVPEGGTLRGVVVKLAPGATIRGRVLGPDDEPVPGARVIARSSDGARRERGARGGPFSDGGSELGEVVDRAPAALASGLGLIGPDAALSGDDGAFEIRGLEAGTWRLVCIRRDLAESRSEPIELAEGATVDGVLLRLARGGGLFGRVVDRFDRPVAGAIVAAASPGGFGRGGGATGDLYQDQSDADGRYAIEHMQAGSFFLAVLRSDDALSVTSLLGSMQFELVTVPEGEMLEHDLVHRAAAACRVYGEVRASGTPVGRGALVAMAFDSDGALGLDLKVARVAADGRYEFAGLAPGAYSFSYQGGVGEVRLEVEIPDLPEHRLDLELPTGELVGRAIDASTSEPVQNAPVLLQREHAGELPGLLGALMPAQARAARTNTDDDGRFRFERLQPGHYELMVGSPRWGPHEGRYAPSVWEPVEIESAGAAERVEIALRPALAIRGTLRSADGARLADAEVRAWREGVEGAAPTRARCDAEGRFELRGLGQGPCELVASADEHADRVVRGVEPGGEALELVLERGVAVRVLVRDAAGRPATGALGRLIDAAADASAKDPRRSVAGLLEGRGVAGADGWIDLGRHVPGAYRLEVSRGAARARREGVRIEDGPTAALEIELVE